jgi:hypothetical protein
VRRLVPGPGYWTPIGGPFGSAIDSAYVVVVNGARLAGSVLFVLAFARAGLSAAAPSRARGAHAATVALGLLIGLPTIAAHLQVTLAAGLPGAAFRGSFGVAADVVCFVLVVPLARIAGAFRGGALAAPWAFLAAGNLGWLVFDAARAAARALGLGEAGRAASGAFVVASCLCALAAGLAHRAAVTAPEGAGAPTVGSA